MQARRRGSPRCPTRGQMAGWGYPWGGCCRFVPVLQTMAGQRSPRMCPCVHARAAPCLSSLPSGGLAACLYGNSSVRCECSWAVACAQNSQHPYKTARAGGATYCTGRHCAEEATDWGGAAAPPPGCDLDATHIIQGRQGTRLHRLSREPRPHDAGGGVHRQTYMEWQGVGRRRRAQTHTWNGRVWCPKRS